MGQEIYTRRPGLYMTACRCGDVVGELASLEIEPDRSASVVGSLTFVSISDPYLAFDVRVYVIDEEGHRRIQDVRNVVITTQPRFGGSMVGIRLQFIAKSCRSWSPETGRHALHAVPSKEFALWGDPLL